MDPLSQGVVGAIAAQASVKFSRQDTKYYAKAALIGALAGMAPDLDVLINSETDSLLYLEYHRQFTHSLFFIPVGGLICAALLYSLLNRWWQLNFKTFFLWSIAGYTSHGLLDSCTSYGTQLFWPFTNYRVSWNIMSIIDPVFTLPLMALVIAACVRKNARWVTASLLWMSCYLLVGVVQNQRAMTAGEALIAQRGHQMIRLEVKPSFANFVLWKIVYETEDRFFVDAVKLGLTQSRVWQGSSVAKLDIDRDLPWLDKSSQQAKDIERFRWFSAGFVSLDPNDPYQVVDMRYSSLPHQIEPLWGIRLSASAAARQHVKFYETANKDRQLNFALLWQMITD